MESTDNESFLGRHMQKARQIAAVVLAVLAVIVIVQNVQSVETRILFITITMPRALLLAMSFAIGFVAGVFSCRRR